jgi:hypothetical protein
MRRGRTTDEREAEPGGSKGERVGEWPPIASDTAADVTTVVAAWIDFSVPLAVAAAATWVPVSA